MNERLFVPVMGVVLRRGGAGMFWESMTADGMISSGWRGVKEECSEPSDWTVRMKRLVKRMHDCKSFSYGCERQGASEKECV